MIRADKCIKIGMVSKGSLASKLFAIKMIAGSQTERKTYMWGKKNGHIHKNAYILENGACWNKNLGPTQIK